MKNLSCVSILLVAFSIQFVMFSQVEIGGIVNQYYPVINYDGCENVLSLGAAADLNPGDKVMIIQMKGAAVTESNNSSFGSILNYGCAGCYEINEVSSVNGSVVYLEYYLENNYNFNASVQLVYIPEYDNVIINQPLEPLPWNGSIGGVLALEVEQVMTMNANINASSRGFRGGNVSANFWESGNCATSGYFFTGTNLKFGAYKGESISNFQAGQVTGRGALANGGGGGNNLNAGGGGGSLYGAGGLGGKEWTGCTGANVGGVGGYQLSNFQTRLFLGGGGGGGHQNNSQSTAGGRGGGIIYVKANEIVSNGNSILSNGETVSVQAGIDGAGGGGAGGMVLINVNQVTGTLNINVRGGNGGNVNNGNTGGSTGGQCHGPGGGGGGGVVLKSGSIVGMTTINSLGGSPGMTVNNQSSCNGTSFGALSGGGGLMIENVSVIVSSVPVEPCEEEEPIDSIVVTNTPEFIPNVFSPNADESNDFFSVSGFELYKDFQIVILNRWGNAMFTSTDPDFAWNGQDQSGLEATEGVYFYLITGLSPFDGKPKEFHGFIHLVR